MVFKTLNQVTFPGLSRCTGSADHPNHFCPYFSRQRYESQIKIAGIVQENNHDTFVDLHFQKKKQSEKKISLH